MATAGDDNGVPPKKTRQQILEAARTVLAHVGYENITTRRIAEEAGVNIATLHYYFGTKEALLSEVLRTALEQALSVLRAAASEARTTEEALASLFQTTWQMVREQRGVLRFDVAVRGLRDETARREANALYDAFRHLNESVLQKHLDEGGSFALGLTAASLAHYMVAATDGVLLQFALTGDDEAAQRSLTLIEQHVLHLLRGDRTGNENL